MERLAKLAGATVRYQPFDGNVSAMFYRADSAAVIGVNSLHAVVRQRFSIAHEIGHFLLHKEQFQIDDSFVVFRGPESGKAVDPMEIEANQFAANLLMPEDLLRAAVLDLGEEPDADQAIVVLSQLFEVSREAMTFRLTKLGWIAE